MRLRAKQFLTITGLTAVEALRQPICLLLVTTCVAFIAFLPFLITHTLGDSDKLVRDSALALHFVCGLLLGGYSACSSLAHELRRGTAASVLSKPVCRETFFLAKYCGVAIAMVLFCAAMSLATILATRTSAMDFGIDWWAAGPLLAAIPVAFALAAVKNYFTKRPFVSSAFGLLLFALIVSFVITGFVDPRGEWVPFGSGLPLKIIPASVLITFAILVLCAVAVSLATRLDTVSTLTLCSAVFILGLMSDYLFGRHAGEHAWAGLLHTVIPNWQHFWAADALTGEGIVPWAYVLHAGSYALLYLAAVLCLGMLAFKRLEIKA